MKKASLIIMLVAMAAAVTAQDTVPILTKKANYFYPNGFHPDSSLTPLMLSGHDGNSGGEMAKGFFAKDTVKVIGIATVVWKNMKSTSYLNYILDTTEEGANSYLRLYTPDHDTGVVRREALFNIFSTPVSYYFDATATISDNPIVPVYELMFEHPIVVFDSFFVGKTFFGTIPSGAHPDGGWYDAHIEYTLGAIGSPSGMQDYIEITLNRFVRENGTTLAWEKRTRQQYLLIWPIIDTVNPTDTTGTSDDTLAIGEPELLHRLTAVTPNPATGRAKVVSSFGLTLVEAFNAAGEKVHELRLPDAPLTATLDVSRWPSGTYILRLHTPQGVASKKLIVK